MKKIDTSIRIGQRRYLLPAISTEQHLQYCDVRDAMTEKTTYGRKDFYAMADCLVELYGNAFTRQELLGPEGPGAGGIIVAFTMIEANLMNQVNASVEEIRENFTAGASSGMP